MPLPLLVVGALWLAGGSGALAGTKGAVDLKKAQSIAGMAQKRNSADVAAHEVKEREITGVLQNYGQRQTEVQSTTLADWVRWLETNERKVKMIGRPVVDGVASPMPDLPALQKLVHQSRLLAGGASAAVSAVVSQQAALAGVRALATASTGAAISGLSGAAAESATLAWLGGGTLASGGGGVAAGAAVMTGVAVAPAALIGGITLAIQGDKALTQAKQHEADVATAGEQMLFHQGLFVQLSRRCAEMRDVLDRLDTRARKSLARLEGLEFDPDRDLAAFHQTALLMSELGQVLAASLLGPDGDLSDESLTIITRYNT
jgi:hypothetical protein